MPAKPPAGRPLPTGTVTFLFTDIEGSTQLWEHSPEAMQAALASHDEVLRRLLHEARASARVRHHNVVDVYDVLPAPEVDDFHIVEYRIFRNVKLSLPAPQPIFEAPESTPPIPDWGKPVVAQMVKKGIATSPSTKATSLTRCPRGRHDSASSSPTLLTSSAA